MLNIATELRNYQNPKFDNFTVSINLLTLDLSKATICDLDPRGGLAPKIQGQALRNKLKIA